MASILLSRDCLNAMHKAYKESDREMFDMDFFTEAIPDCDEEMITDALNALESMGLVTIFRADGIAYVTTYLPDAGRDLVIKQGVNIAKEIKDLVLGFFQ